MSWSNEVYDRLERNASVTRAGGGQARLDTQHRKGKLSARERINLLFDPGTFQELSAYAESRFEKSGAYPGDGVITGSGLINGRIVFAAAEDFTVIGGTMGEIHAKKMCRMLDLALAKKAPVVMLNDGGGARIGEGVASLAGYGGLFRRHVAASGVIPQIAAVMGPCAGGACYAPAICDFVFMVRPTSYMFITGPQVVKAVSNEDTSLDELGGAAVHESSSGVAHFVAENDAECLQKIRLLLSYLPQVSGQPLPRTAPAAPASRVPIPELVPENGRITYDVHTVLDTLVDKDSFFEIQAQFAPNIIVGLARMNGQVTGIIANQPAYAGGSLDINASDKVARFLRFCDCFRIPIITLVDVPAFLPGRIQEHGGIIRHGAKILYAYAEATVPKITLIMRKAYGGAYIALGSKAIGADLVLAWPIAQIGVMGAAGAVDILHRHTLAEAANPEPLRASLIASYEEEIMSPYTAARLGEIDEVILPEQTRDRLIRALLLLKEANTLPGTHGNIPL